jgi:purine/pyrimidine-nucleoside phosphorylase
MRPMKHNTYFEGKVQSLELATSGGRATVGVIEPGSYTFSTSSEEHIVVVDGTLKAKLPGAGWRSFANGQEIVVPAGVSFDVEAAKDVAYICYYR